MARVLVLGASGFIGPSTVRALESAGHDAIASSRASQRYAADRLEPASVLKLVQRERCDTLIDMIAYDAAPTERLWSRLAQTLSRYVLVSSADVYRSYGALHRREAADVSAELISEAAPTRSSRFPYREERLRDADSPEAWKDHYDKIGVEDAVTSGSAAIIRLPMVYGPGDRNDRFAWIRSPMRAKAARLEAPAAWLDWTTTYGHVDNVAAAIALCAVHPSAAGHVFNCGEPAVSHRVWVSRFSALLGWSGAVVDRDDAPIARALTRLDLRHALALDTGKIRSLLGYAEPVGIEDALASIV